MNQPAPAAPDTLAADLMDLYQRADEPINQFTISAGSIRDAVTQLRKIADTGLPPLPTALADDPDVHGLVSLFALKPGNPSYGKRFAIHDVGASFEADDPRRAFVLENVQLAEGKWIVQMQFIGICYEVDQVGKDEITGAPIYHVDVSKGLMGTIAVPSNFASIQAASDYFASHNPK